jgi:hypothetical protein
MIPCSGIFFWVALVLGGDIDPRATHWLCYTGATWTVPTPIVEECREAAGDDWDCFERPWAYAVSEEFCEVRPYACGKKECVAETTPGIGSNPDTMVCDEKGCYCEDMK